MRVWSVIIFACLLCGCERDKSDLELFVTSTKAEHVAHITPLKETPKFEHFAYSAELMRSPYIPPKRELTAEAIESRRDCLQPNFKRHKGQLETYALDNLKMRGTLSGAGKIWALIESSDGNVYRLGAGQHLGLYHGKIAKVTPQEIEIVELIPDGTGCWTERNSSMELIGE